MSANPKTYNPTTVVPSVGDLQTLVTGTNLPVSGGAILSDAVRVAGVSNFRLVIDIRSRATGSQVALIPRVSFETSQPHPSTGSWYYLGASTPVSNSGGANVIHQAALQYYFPEGEASNSTPITCDIDVSAARWFQIALLENSSDNAVRNNADTTSVVTASYVLSV